MLGTKQMTGRQRLFAGLVVAFMTAFILYSIFGDDGLIDYFHLRDKSRSLVATNDAIGRQNLELYRVIERLSGDLDYIETMARRELGMVTPEEFIFKFETGPGPPRVVTDTGVADEPGAPPRERHSQEEK
ncbi:MAG: septum formation initiator family protein [Desulfosarcinaceae bacterium]|jgi:cell division protein FtsB